MRSNRTKNTLRIRANGITKENVYGNKCRAIAAGKGPAGRESRAFRNITNLHPAMLKKHKEETALRKLQDSSIEDELAEAQANRLSAVLTEQTSTEEMKLETVTKESPQDCEEYSKEIDKHMKSLESKYTVNPAYMYKQKDITTTMRAILVDWLVDVHIRFKLKSQTLFLTVNVLDRYLEKEQVKRDYLQLVGVTAAFVACKYEEIYPPELKDFVYITDYAYTKEQILCAEQKILCALSFNLNAPTSYQFLQRFSKLFKPCDRAVHLVQYLLELSLIESGMLMFTPSVLAASALSVSNRVCGNNIEITGSQEDCMENMMTILREAPNGSLQAVRRKFSHEQFLNVAQIEFF
eukprot:TRINITY_DN16166_c0_g1_i2.p1 TRINITY_DN16166_c0_g1~~TRINITY_DN16166_c0_g1_i2.p1  ORF type:complete len:351 (+),score=70.20 TRINITY_DN16166_c0_g1_i2:117-1169(+)